MSQIGDMVNFCMGRDILVGRVLKIIETEGKPWVKVRLERDWYSFRDVPYLMGETFLLQQDLVQKQSETALL